MLPKDDSQASKESAAFSKAKLTAEHCRTQEEGTFDQSNPPFKESKQIQSGLERDSLRISTRIGVGNIFLLNTIVSLSTTFFILVMLLIKIFFPSKSTCFVLGI